MNLCKKVNIFTKNIDTSSIINHIIESGKEDAFFICDVGRIIENHKSWNAALPKVDTYYAIKCNDEPEILETIAALGIGFDCASKNEIHKVLSMGVHPDRILFANPVKAASHLRYAKETGIKKMTFDNESELVKIKEVYPEAELIIRIKCDSPTATFRLGEKFGCDHSLEAPKLLQVAKELCLNVIGISFHIGSNVSDYTIFQTALYYARYVYDVSVNLGFKFTLLDIGGGFPGTSDHSIENIGKLINPILDDYFSDLSMQFIAEPGRYFVQYSCTLACQITSIRSVLKKTNDSEAVPHNMYYINDGIYGSFNCVLFGEDVHPKPLKETKNDLISSSIWGPSCCSFDVVVKDVPLQRMSVGDWITFNNMGSYSICLATKFNGFNCPEAYVVIEKPAWDSIKNDLPIGKPKTEPKEKKPSKKNTRNFDLFQQFKTEAIMCSKIKIST